MKTALFLLVSVPVFQPAHAASEAVPGASAIPPASVVIAHLLERDAERHAALAGYTATRRYTLDNRSRHASMVVHASVDPDGTKQFTIVDESGSSAVRKHVFHKILEEESTASNPKARSQSQISPENYWFEGSGVEMVNNRRAYVIDLKPRKESKYLIAGRIWVDAEDYAVMRVEGKPAKNPSFWTKRVHFVHEYEKNGLFWFPVSNRSDTDARIFGRADLNIEYFDYTVSSPTPAQSAAAPGLVK
jgi:outer membrane lipoprotein-sorting protein